ncbi:transmembrane protein 65 isoform X2 [Drosophila grimshawi]|uniref:transmembrane protein 65 isoform X2 n=1 Tax=Drosophila grimshawi TaxID=7222 RepID=UPI000C86F59F|nr:transmembrane protein 65 isoform X2 [Drosophila grimshawi]
MRQQWRDTFRHLVRQYHTQSKRAPLLANSNSRRLACNNNSSRHNNLRQQQLQQQQLILFANSRNYSKFGTHLSSERAMELLCNLDEDERHNLRDAMFKLEADKVKKQFEMEAAEPPTARQLYSIFFVNAVPFVAFGFLDNFIMIMAGEYIESTLGHFITLSTMAAAGLGNTISDVMGITMATYVEEGCQLLGLKPPQMTPAQFELKSSRRASSWGRIMGITVGCLIGMCPLWFMKEEPKASAKD